ncbi:E3 ubiquitin-protein ligase TRIM56 [Holothuria leucospilota]|uniref:E3 ubiquitin-protein ligase TRIM56 n=1 Tax=Holothuria leucospilota TaxID=206669 RepID=A0A9Q1BTP1_HOLLE|nr:E3 ubiquitin-protein ligase TRIM56 [Holothuria leucospilota]
MLSCPECWEEIEIPPTKADGYPTDFYLKSLVEKLKIKESLHMEQICKCFNCPENPPAVVYCLACNDFLCKKCCDSHKKKKALKDHQLQFLSHNYPVSKDFTVDQLASMMDAPRCHAHPDNTVKLYCCTCKNIPVCHECISRDHKGHRLSEVSTLANLLREKLTKKLQILEKVDNAMYLIPCQNSEGQAPLNAAYKDRIMTVKERIKDVREGLELVKAEKENVREKILSSIEEEMEEEIKQVKEKYKKIVHDLECKTKEDFYSRQDALEKEMATLLEELNGLEKNETEFILLKEAKKDGYVGTQTTTLEGVDSKRIDNLKVVASGLLVSKNNWAAVECIPAINAAVDNLIYDINKIQGTKYDNASNVYARSIFGKDDTPKISEDAEKVVTIEGNQVGGRITGIASSGDGNIVVTGRYPTGNESYIFVIDENGKKIKGNNLVSSTNRPWRYCDYLTQFKVASVCERTEVGIYDVRDGSYTGKNITDVISSWPEGREVRCVATDNVNNHILVGGYDSRDVYVFDDQLNYRGYSLTLPKEIRWPRDMAIRGSYLLVCDRDGKKSFLTTMGVSTIKVLHELRKPDSYDWRPVSVCIDKSGFIYILWQAINRPLTTKRCVVVQYSQNGRQVLTTRPVDGDAQCIATLDKDEGVKLLVQTWETGRLYIYGLL